MRYHKFGRHPVTPSPRHPWRFLAAFALLCFGLEVQAETISIIASDNAWVAKNAPDDDQKEDNQKVNQEGVHVMSDGSDSWSRFTYLRFDVSPLAGGTITSASLDMHWINASGANTVYVCALNDLADGGKGTTETSWDGHITWNNQPQGLENLPNGKTSGPLASLPASGNVGKAVSFDLTSALPDLLVNDTNHQLTLILYGNTGKWSNFGSLENPQGYPVPTLRVTGEGFNPEAAIPEPGTLALLGMALLGLGWYAWRKRGVRG